MAKSTYAKPTTTNASFLKVPVNLDFATETAVTWADIVNKMPLKNAAGQVPIKAIKLGAITVGGSPEAPAHIEFKGGQTFELPALATKPMRVKASEKNLYVSGWRRISADGSSVYSNTDDDDLSNSVVFKARGQVAFIEVALRFYDDVGYRSWTTGGGGLGQPDYVRYQAYPLLPSFAVKGKIGSDESNLQDTTFTQEYVAQNFPGFVPVNDGLREEHYPSIDSLLVGAYVSEVPSGYLTVSPYGESEGVCEYVTVYDEESRYGRTIIQLYGFMAR